MVTRSDLYRTRSLLTALHIFLILVSLSSFPDIASTLQPTPVFKLEPIETPDLPDDGAPLDYDLSLYRKHKAIPGIFKRELLGKVLEYEGLKTGVELGVQSGQYSETLLSEWSKCERYLLVDIWAPQENYGDGANVNQRKQDKFFQQTKNRVQRFGEKIEICRNFTTYCAQTYSKDSFDFVYVDARHDYKGVMVDLVDWWPLVKENGIMAGHDFVYQWEGPKWTKQNWTINYDGTVDLTGRTVRGAVEDFFGDKSRPDRYRKIYRVRERSQMWPTWMVRK